MELSINPKTTVLLVLDIQNATVNRQMLPNDTADVVKRAAEMASAFRKAGSQVFMVNLSYVEMFKPKADVESKPLNLVPDWDKLSPGLGVSDTDIRVTKAGWSAFVGTDLHKQLQHLGISTIVLCGISTNIGVESTARDAYDLNYNQIFAVDAMAAKSAQEHEHTIKFIFGRIGLVRNSEDIISAINSASK